ncbi:DEAD/DEAH box helicase family protein [Algoriphagus boritolerans]|uniref:DEAD/DEAH box helicase family protein n=1 Tax=Algoriphagus boritolerans TaxID=308111 RepID=UPI000A512690
MKKIEEEVMELKPYQQEVINDLSLFLESVQETKDTALAFHNFWSAHPKTPLMPFPGTAIEPYKNNVPRVPHICLKVPTAGGKTFIACNAIKTIFDAFNYDKPKAVVWLVPSITILEQTIKNLKDPSHPYRQKKSILTLETKLRFLINQPCFRVADSMQPR